MSNGMDNWAETAHKHACATNDLWRPTNLIQSQQAAPQLLQSPTERSEHMIRCMCRQHRQLEGLEMFSYVVPSRAGTPVWRPSVMQKNAPRRVVVVSL